MPPARFSVGDRAEYWSDTYQQWMPGIIQRVRDGGAAYDLDVKKGAQASRLRMARNPAANQDVDNLFSVVDRNHDGIISRTEFRGAVQAHVIEGNASKTASLSAPLVAVPPVAVPPTAPGRTVKSSSLSASARGTGGFQQELDLPAQRRRPASRDPGACMRGRSHDTEVSSDLWRRCGNAASTVPAVPLQDARGKSPRSTALQAKQLHTELAHATRAIQAQNGEWSEQAGQDMVSRAGAVTVRKMVETTKALLQGLEGALILRAGFIAGCFHMWRCETTLSRAGRLYQEEFERHHDQWAAHLDHHKKSFEAELRAHAERTMTHRDRMRQQNALLLDQWSHGERQGLLRESLRSWRAYAVKEKGLKRAGANIHKALYTWLEGKKKGSVHASFAAWHHLTEAQREVRRSEGEMNKIHKSYQSKLEDQNRQHDKMLQDKLQAIEARDQKGHRDIEFIIAKWEKGCRKGTLTVVLQAWGRWSRGRKTSSRRAAAVDMELRRWAEGKVRGDLHCCYLHWRSHAVQTRLARRHQDALEAEHAGLQKMLVDQQKRHTDLLHQHMSEAQRLRDRQKNTVEVALAKWELGDRRGLLRSTLRHWGNSTKQVKRLSRKRQAVHSAMIRAVEGDRRGAKHISFLNWAALTRSEKHARMMEERVAHEANHWQGFLEETERGYEDKLKTVSSSVASHKAQAHAATELMVKKWIEGDGKGLKATVFADWKRLKDDIALKDRKRNAVKDTVLRFVEGENRGVLHSVFQGWKNYVLWEVAHNHLHKEKDRKIEQLEQQAEQLLSHRLKGLERYCELLASRSGATLKGMCFSGWKDESLGIKGEIEAQREAEVRLQEMERAHKMADTLHKEEKLKALDAMGMKNSRVALFESFAAWSYFVQRIRDAWTQKCNHSEAMHKYSLFVIDQKLKKDSAALMASCFAEWHREGKISYHERLHEDAQRSAEEQHAYVTQLEQRSAELQDQLCIYYQQIDLITETLQKELKTKEELATELRSAYAKMRRSNFTPTTAAGSDRVGKDVGTLSRTSSDQTLDQVVTTPRPAHKVSAASSLQVQRNGQWRLGLTGTELPPSPSLPFPRCTDLLRGRGADTGQSSREVSPSQCGWEQAVERMGEEGIVRMDRSSNP